MHLVLLGLSLHACGPADPSPSGPPPIQVPTRPTSPSGPVDVLGLVTGWDGSGDVAIEACGRGALVDDARHTFAMRAEASCPVRVVWERSGYRTEGPWHELPTPPSPPTVDEVPEVRLTLPMPEEAALRPLSEDERAYREEVIREAQELLLSPAVEAPAVVPTHDEPSSPAKEAPVPHGPLG